jgi:hypothetical protein
MHMIVGTILHKKHEIKLDTINKLLIDSKIRKKNPFEKFKWTIKSDDSSKELKENLKVMVNEIKGRNTSKC